MPLSENEPSEVISSPPAENVDQRENRIGELLREIGGLEASILYAMEQRDYPFADKLKALRPNKYERLRRLMYGLPEESTLRAEG